jgi:hypothetical protein
MSGSLVNEFLNAGAVTVDSPLSAEQIRAAAAVVDHLIPFRESGPGEKPRFRYQVGQCYFDPALLDIIQHPFFEETAKTVLAAEAVTFFQTAITATYPQPDVPFSFDQHVDIQYRTSDFEAVPRRVICSFFLWLTDVNERRAPMMFRPGSHLLLAAENERRGAGPEEVGTVRGVLLEHLPSLGYAEPQPLTATVGQVSVLTTSAVHGASVNVDRAPRKGMVFTFAAEGVEIRLPERQSEEKRRYDRELRSHFRPERVHLLNEG